MVVRSSEEVLAERDDELQINPQISTPEKSNDVTAGYIVGLPTCILSHVLFGLQPILSRYLQHGGASKNVPAMSLILASNLLVLLVYSPRILYLLVRYVITTRAVNRNQESDFHNTVGPSDYSLRDRIFAFLKRYLFLAVFIISRVIRTCSNVLSSRFTNAIYVQLFGLSTPFIVSILSFAFVNRFVSASQKERWTKRSVCAMIVTVFGGFLIVVGGAVYHKNQALWYEFLVTWRIDWSRLVNELDGWDGLGMGLSLVSSFCLSVYMISIRFMNRENTETVGATFSEEKLYLMQVIAVSIAFVIPTFAFEDWRIWLDLKLKDYLVFMLFSLCNYFAANFLYIYACSILGASATGSILALRMVSTIAFSGVVLNEWFVSIWQVIGSAIVMTSVTYFLYCQNEARKILNQTKDEELLPNHLQEIEIELEEELIDERTEMDLSPRVQQREQ